VAAALAVITTTEAQEPGQEAGSAYGNSYYDNKRSAEGSMASQALLLIVISKRITILARPIKLLAE